MYLLSFVQVPQWSVSKTPSAMQPSHLGEELAATPVRNGPGVALGSRTHAGTWIGTKKVNWDSQHMILICLQYDI